MSSSDSQSAVSPDKGVYALWLHLARTQWLTIGKLGSFQFPAGVYVYCGSAQQHLTARVRRHLRVDHKRCHWHIDYLRQVCRALGVVTLQARREEECRLAARFLQLPGSATPAPGFGSSDCTCHSHLVYTPLFRPREAGLPCPNEQHKRILP